MILQLLKAVKVSYTGHINNFDVYFQILPAVSLKCSVSIPMKAAFFDECALNSLHPMMPIYKSNEWYTLSQQLIQNAFLLHRGPREEVVKVGIVRVIPVEEKLRESQL